MSSVERSPGVPGLITAIKPAYKLGGEGEDPIAIVEFYNEGSGTVEAWIPLKDPNLEPGDSVTMVTVDTSVGKGRLITYELTPNLPPGGIFSQNQEQTK